ncbi:unnamed protein product [Caenorhabditis sp. 36 PRJEB53466]|nr:unnamed protein product [Caenorhabditis sp. 36 PRJEB53466]
MRCTLSVAEIPSELAQQMIFSDCVTSGNCTNGAEHRAKRVWYVGNCNQSEQAYGILLAEVGTPFGWQVGYACLPDVNMADVGAGLRLDGIGARRENVTGERDVNGAKVTVIECAANTTHFNWTVCTRGVVCDGDFGANLAAVQMDRSYAAAVAVFTQPEAPCDEEHTSRHVKIDEFIDEICKLSGVCPLSRADYKERYPIKDPIGTTHDADPMTSLKNVNFLIVLLPCLVLFLVFVYNTNETSWRRVRMEKAGSSGIFGHVDATNNVMNVCALPVYDVWHPTILEHWSNYSEPQCDRHFRPYTWLVNGTWGIADERQGTNCSARCFESRSGWFPPGNTDCHFLETVCWEGSEEVYGYIHTQVIPKRINNTTARTRSLPNVFVFLMDSMSTGMARRDLPRTLSILRDRLDAVEFPFVNKVGENSKPNAFAIWFGKFDRNYRKFGHEVLAGNSSEFYGGADLNEGGHIFKDFRQHGYVTAYQDDWMDFRADAGFKTSPVDVEMGPFQIIYEQEGLNVTRTHLNGTHCRDVHHAHLDHFEQFLDAYKDVPKFSWMWLNRPTHDTFYGLGQVDGALAEFFEKNQKVMDESFVFFLGDHGFRMNPYVTRTEIGAFEISNPYLSIAVPKKYRTSLLETMRTNSAQLQTHFDTRSTLLDIVKYQPLANFTARDWLPMHGEKGHSLVRAQPNTSRTCGRLPIPMQYCICRTESVEVTDQTIKARFAQRLIDRVHQILADSNLTSMCEPFTFDEEKVELHDHGVIDGLRTYQIQLWTNEPMNVNLETVFTHSAATDIIEFEQIGRLDEYGTTADCTRHARFNPLCYCKK